MFILKFTVQKGLMKMIQGTVLACRPLSYESYVAVAVELYYDDFSFNGPQN